jgi:hypothetical protein
MITFAIPAHHLNSRFSTSLAPCFVLRCIKKCLSLQAGNRDYHPKLVVHCSFSLRASFTLRKAIYQYRACSFRTTLKCPKSGRTRKSKWSSGQVWKVRKTTVVDKLLQNHLCELSTSTTTSCNVKLGYRWQSRWKCAWMTWLTSCLIACLRSERAYPQNMRSTCFGCTLASILSARLGICEEI